MSDSVRLLSDEEICEHCRVQTQVYLDCGACDEYFCFELLSRVRAGGSALRKHVRRIYAPVVDKMIIRHDSAKLLDEITAEETIHRLNQQIMTEWLDKLESEGFELRTLRPALKYLRMIVRSRLFDELRRQRRHAIPATPIQFVGEIAADPAESPALVAELRDLRLRVASRLRRLLSDDDVRLCYLRYGEGLRPDEIVRRYPERWPDLQPLYRKLHKLKALIYDDPELRRLARLDEE